ncbi:MAG: HEXXH motif-containing putative peptide modification protein [Novosphingobium sp.]
MKQITIVRSAGECFDTSHSDPAWPGIVLVSIPPQGPVADLRLAEGIIHEAMHHHLSALEANMALVHEQRLLHSPWRDTDRPAGGVLHGLFVFASVAHAFQNLIDLGSLREDALRHARKRIGEIRDDIASIDHGGLSNALTARGRVVQAAACRAVEH